MAGPDDSQEAEELKRQGTAAYAQQDWASAAELYTAALKSCTASSELALTCLNNRAACFQQLKQHDLVVRDTSEVIKQQPANLKALLRRMVALDAAGRQEEALQDARDVLTLEPKNHHALQVVARKRQNLNKKATDWLPPTTPDASVAVFLFTEDRPLQCYGCLKSLKHLRNAHLHVIVFWQAAERSCMHSYQLLQALPELKVPRGQLVWMEVGKGRLFENFSRSVGRLSVEGIRSLMILSDTAVFHSDVDLSAATAVLSDRSDTFAVRLDLNPRVEYFPKNQLCASAPHLKPFAKDERLVLWTRKFDATKQAYEAVPRESGWDEILDWTASLVRAQQISHFFSALQGQQVETIQQMDDKAADWLSRRQRMKRSEVSHRSACFVQPLLVSLDPEIFGPPKEADALLRRTLHESWKDRLPSLAKQLSWSEAEVGKYFEGFPSSDRDSSVECLQCLLDPLRYRDHYLDSVQIGSAPKTGLPQQLSDTPLVSWLIPARNCEYFILDCLRSIEKQVGLTPGCYEVVVVEDASEDRTDAVLQNFAKTRPYVRIIESDGVQQGVSGSLQVGWSHCRGSYIARLDADDEADPHRLLKQLRFLEQHPEVSVVGGRASCFFSEERKFSVEKISQKEDGRVVAAVWREFHGQQTSRAREQICLAQRGEDVVLMDGPAEYSNCRLLRIGDESMVVSPERWQEALATPGTEVLLLRSDPCEPASGGSFWHHPSILRMGCIFEDALIGTTLCFRRAHFQECPFPREEAENHWLMVNLEPHQHVANLADVMVRTRRHEGNRAVRDEAGIHESRCAAIQHYLKKVYKRQIDMHDAAALLNFRGPRTPEQGEKLLQILEDVERSFFSNYIRQAEKGDFWKDFVEGREVALERAIVSMRLRFRALHQELAQVITNVPDNSPRQHRSRTPPR